MAIPSVRFNAIVFLASSCTVLYAVAERQEAPQGLPLTFVILGTLGFLFAVFSAINIYDAFRIGFSRTRR